jgi:hypothetical protein
VNVENDEDEIPMEIGGEDEEIVEVKMSKCKKIRVNFK